jgi:glutathione S-transferase
MDPILFYGVPEGCSFGSIVALEWSGLRYGLCRIEMPGVVSGLDFKRLNPIGETPVLMTGAGEPISESVAILHHIDARSPTPLAPRSREFDRVTQSLAFLNTTFFSAFSPLWHTVEHELSAAEQAAFTAYGTAKVRLAHEHLERMLTGRDWLAGSRRSVADAYFAGIARWADFHRVIDRRNYPRVNQLYERLQEDPAVRFALAIEHEEEAASAGGFAGHVTLAEALALLRETA